MKKLTTLFIALFTFVILSTSVLGAGAVFGPYWFDCQTVAPWYAYDFDTCSGDQRIDSTVINIGVNEVMAVGLAPQFTTENPVQVTMKYRKHGSTSWTTFYDASVNTQQQSYAPFVADTVSFPSEGTWYVTTIVTPNGEGPWDPMVLSAIVSGDGDDNQPPTIMISDDFHAVDEGETVEFTVSASDPDGDDLSIWAADLPGGATFTNIGTNLYRFRWVTDSSDGATPYATYTPDFHAADAEFEVEDSATIRVTDVPVDDNECPILLISDDFHEVVEGETVIFTVTGIDPDGDMLDMWAADLPDGATFTLTGFQEYLFSWTTDSSDGGIPFNVYTPDFYADDGQCPPTHDYAIIRVIDDSIDDNHAPVWNYETLELHTPEDVDPVVLSPIGNPVNLDAISDDIDGDNLQYSIIMESNSGLIDCYLYDTDNHLFTCHAPAADQTGSSQLLIRASDGELHDDMLVRVIVDPVNDAPILEPVDDMTVCAGDLVEVTASATDVDDAVLTYGMTPAGYFVQSDDYFVWATDMSDVSATPYPFTLSASDSVNTVFQSFTVLVEDCSEDHAPVANFNWFPEEPELCDAFVIVEFDGTTSWDPDGDALDYYWDFDGDSLPDAAGDVVTHQFTEVGWHTVTLTVDDGTYQDTIVRNVYIADCSENEGPVAMFDWTPIPTELCDDFVIVTYNGSDSWDPEDDLLSFEWDFGNDGTLDNTGMVTTYAYDDLGVYEVLLTVSDGTSSDDLVQIIEVVECSTGQDPVAEFNWTPFTPQVGEDVLFDASLSWDPDGDDLFYYWDLDNDGVNDEIGLFTDYVFDEPGFHTVTLTVSDGVNTGTRSHQIQVLSAALEIVDLTCFNPVVVGHEQACSIDVEANGMPVGDAEINLYMNGTDEFLGTCMTNELSGSCAIEYIADTTGIFTVYATAERMGFMPDDDQEPKFTYAVVDDVYDIQNLAVYEDPAYSIERYDFYRAEDMFVKFQVLDELSQITNTPLVEELVTSVTLLSPIGGGAVDFTEDFDLDDGWYYYNLTIPPTHEFIGNSQIFVFAFNTNMTEGGEMIVAVRIYNNPPEILAELPDEFMGEFNDTVEIDLTPYEFDIEDSGENLTWVIADYDAALFDASIITMTDDLTLDPHMDGTGSITLRLYDLDMDYDEFTYTITFNGTSDDNDTNDTNIPPVAVLNAAPDTGEAPLFVVLDGSDSYDVDGEIVEYMYVFGDGLSTVMMSGHPVAVGHTYTTNGTYIASITVFDNESASDIAFATIVVGDGDNDTNTTNVAPVAILDVTPNEGDPVLNVTVNGNASYDVDGVIVEFSYDFGDGMWTGPMAGEPMPMLYSYDTNGTYTVVLTVMDNNGSTSTDSVVVVVGDGIPPGIPQCSDGIDNDGDGKVDLFDPGCDSATDDDESDEVNGASTWANREKMDKELTINRIDIRADTGEPDMTTVGGELFVEVTVENGFNYEIEDLDVVVWIDELGIRKSHKVDIGAEDEEHLAILFDIPDYAYPGYYDVMVSASNDDFRRVKYRDFAIVE